MTDFKNRSISISEHVDSLSANYKNFMNCFPKIYLAAETINDILDQFFTERFEYNDRVLWESVTSILLFGVHISWVQAFYLIASGLSNVGLSASRKSVEYVCYISKMYNSNERAKLWKEKNDDIEKAKSFSSQFSIPKSYFGKKYEKLIPLLVYYDYASNFGVHGNLLSFATKWKEVKQNGSIEMTFQDDFKWVPESSSMTVQIGSFIIDALLNILKDDIKELDEFKEKIVLKEELVRNARIESAEYTYGKSLDSRILKAINDNNMSGIYGLFEEIKSKYK